MRVFIAGHRGMVGSAINRNFKSIDGVELITVDRRSLDLLDQKAVHEFLKNHPRLYFLGGCKSWRHCSK